MHPAYSVIFFTVSSGAGFGLLAVISLGVLLGIWHPQQAGATNIGIALLLGITLAIAGLLSSTFHLGHPERAWRAMSQWRSSWLSREGVLAISGFIPVAALILAWWLPESLTFLLKPAALFTVLLMLATVFSTAMIYASLTTIPRWNQPLVPPVYVLFALASGAMLTTLFAPDDGNVVMTVCALLVLLAWACKWLYWRTIDRAETTSTAESATGLEALGTLSTLDPPHTSANYVQKEMGFAIARKHAVKLRGISLMTGLILPLLLLVGAAMTAGLLHVLLVLAATFLLSLALLIERWLFFAEAEHVVSLFYGKSAV